MKHLEQYIKQIVKEEIKNRKPNKGGLTLWHYARRDEPEITLDPKMFGANFYTRKEKNVSDVPRVFFYTNPKERESFFNPSEHKLYKITVPTSSVYDLGKDPMKLKGKFVDLHEMLEFISGWQKVKGSWKKKKGGLGENIKGVKYNVGAFNVVIWFEPIVVSQVSEEEREEVE